MGRDIALNFPPLRRMRTPGWTRSSSERDCNPLSGRLSAARLRRHDGSEQEKALRNTEYAQAAIGVFSAGLFTFLAQAGFEPDFAAGHSFGELAALWAGGVLSDADFLRLVKARGGDASPRGPALRRGRDAGGAPPRETGLTNEARSRPFRT